MQNAETTKEAIKKGFTDKVASLKERIAKGEVIPHKDKIQVAVLADSPTVVTGFGNVCREILMHLHNTGMYAFDIVGINYDGSPHDLPFKIFPAINALVGDPMYREPYGRQRFLDMIGEGRFDLVWVLQDSFIIAEELGQRIKETNDSLPANEKFQFIFYFPIDATPKKHWIDKSVMFADFPVVYTQYGYDEVMKVYAVDEHSKLDEKEKQENADAGAQLKERLSVIYHGVNTKDFYPMPEDEVRNAKQQFWGAHKDKFVFINVNRNQPRKDLYRTLLAFKILLDRRRAQGKDDVYLYIHCNVFDNNINLLDVAKQIDLVQGDEFAFPDPKIFGPAMGFPVRMLNQLYNASDAVITTTLGEGWGLSVTEAMAVKRPVIAPDHTSLTEMLGKTERGGGERGLLVKTEGSFVQQNDNGRIRPVTDAKDLADQMEWLVDNREVAQGLVDPAYAWVKALEWGGEAVGGKWLQVFEAAYAHAIQARAMALDEGLAKQFKEQGLSRNDQCPACKVKIKLCRHGQ